jgi:hypothetical protein
MNDNEITIRVKEDLHPKTRRFPFVDKQDKEYRSVAEAYVTVTKGKTPSLLQAMTILIKIIISQVEQNADLKAIFQASVGKTFTMTQKTFDFIPFKGFGSVANGNAVNLYGICLNKARDTIINRIKKATAGVIDVMESTGAVPEGAVPCLKCGGEGDVAGSGYWAAVADDRNPEGWKYSGPCFDCLPKGDTSGRGKGYITRSIARKLWTWASDPRNAHKIQDRSNFRDPDDASIWKIIPKCKECGVEAGQGVQLFIGRGEDPTLCKTCVENNGGGVNMKPINEDVVVPL